MNEAIRNSESKSRYISNSRKIILSVLSNYFKNKGSLKTILNKYLHDPHLTELDRRFITNISRGTIRFYIKIDYIISLLSKKEISDIEPDVLNILRMALYQKEYMDKVPDYSIVNESVELAKRYISLPSSKFVNAILRKLCSIKNLEIFYGHNIDRSCYDEILKSSIDYSFPEWLVSYWKNYFGIKLTEKIMNELNRNPIFHVRLNNLKITDEGIDPKEVFNRLADKIIPQNSCDTGMFGLDTFASDRISEIREDADFKKGYFYLQNLSSQLAVKFFLNPCKNESILDLCAAPGGKTALMAEIMQNTGKIISVDISQERINVLKENISRMGLKNVSILLADVAKEKFMESRNCGLFDKILLDLPCSSLGTIAKNPDVKYSYSINDIGRLARQSLKILNNCHDLLKTGGNILFYTCTLSPIENQEVISKFLTMYSGSYVVDRSWQMTAFGNEIAKRARELLADSLEDGNRIEGNIKSGFFEFMPFYFRSEGGFACSLKKVKGNMQKTQ